MKLLSLINYLKQQADQSIYIHGRYGFIYASPQPIINHQSTYCVHSTYHQPGRNLQINHQDGFRLSTICCLSVGVLFGEEALNNKVIAIINACF